ncbi:MAG TPA: RecQ family ATP-dependent DNA helicase [Dehalococcoidia bacterium]|nr:RecQ family ATP-dependent DNA helicase [Dehalococcoidia bacterium]
MTALSVARPSPSHVDDKAIAQVLRKYWGYDKLRPLQKDAIEAGVAKQDSLVVLPTGGGKSLCYQVPPLVANRVDIVVSPLISLMKDQVDALRACGYPATALHGGLGDEERRRELAEINAGKKRLIFVAPERLLTPWFLSLAERLKVRAFAIDEAHCISQWGHDFRPEYRRLAQLKERFHSASMHALTATATPRVREDIIRQLKLKDPKLLVGRFDRANLVYRVVPRADLDEQVHATVKRHEGEAAIVYCISRADTERMAAVLKQRGVKAAPYHAGLDPIARERTQEAFAKEKLDVVVATVAFGMGIDRSNVRCVIHAAMPKSIEHYQQETGRAGRDGLEAECVLFYSPADFRRWEFMLKRSGSEGEQPAEVTQAQIELLAAMQRYASSGECRHGALSRYFGQKYEAASCAACDVCLGERREVDAVARMTSRDAAGWEGVDKGLFDHLREIRRTIAAEQNVAAFIVFGDATLRELARVRPTTLVHFGRVRGVGERKLVELGARFVAEISGYCSDHSLPANVTAAPLPQAVRVHSTAPTTLQKLQAFDLFDKQRSLEEVVAETGRARATVSSYLEDYVVERKPESVDAWVAPDLYRRIEEAAGRVGGSLLRPVFEALEGEVSYDDIRVVMRHAGRR